MRGLLLALPLLAAALPAGAEDGDPLRVLTRKGEGGLLGREVLERLEEVRTEYEPRFVTEKGRGVFKGRLDLVTRRLKTRLEKPTGVTDEHLGTLRGFWDVTVTFDAALDRAAKEPTDEARAELDDARNELRRTARALDGLPELLRPEHRPPPEAPVGGGEPPRRPPFFAAFLAQLGDHRGARGAFGEAAAADPKSAAALSGRAASAFAMGDYGAAFADAKRALELDPADRTAYATLKLTEGRAGSGAPAGAPASASAPAAPAAAAAAASRGPGAPMAAAGSLEAARWNQAALAAMKLGDRAAALAAADRALEAYASNPLPYLVRARFALLDRDYRAALEHAEAGLRLAPADRGLLSAKGRAAVRLRQAPPAGEAARALLGLDGSDAEGLAILAHARGLSGEREGMMTLLRQAAAADPAYQASLDTAVRMPPDAAELFLFPGENASRELLAALRAPAAPPQRDRTLWFAMGGLLGGLVLAAPFALRRRG